MVQERIEREIDISAPVEKVWAAITEAEHLGTWFGDAGATVDLRPGGRITLSWKDHPTAVAVVEKVEPTAYLSYRWSGPLHEEPGEGNSTLIEFTLHPIEEGTRLRVVESGFRDLVLSAEARASYFDGNVDGWKQKTEELRAHVER
ncbi:MAG TPA: SRPBCC family protein [Umezawaea sp.]|nr:SRPBCC family protein [Umezawaea sp.]